MFTWLVVAIVILSVLGIIFTGFSYFGLAETLTRLKLKVQAWLGTQTWSAKFKFDWVNDWIAEIKTNHRWQAMSQYRLNWVILPILLVGVLWIVYKSRSFSFWGTVDTWLTKFWNWITNPNFDSQTFWYIGIATTLCGVAYLVYKLVSAEARKEAIAVIKGATKEGLNNHWKAVLGTFFGILFFNLFLAYVEPFTEWHKSFRDTGWNFFWINAAICFATLMVAAVGGDTGKKLSRLAWGLTAIALITFTWNYTKVWPRVTGFFGSETASAQSTPATVTGTGKKFEGNARDYEPFKGPERDSVMKFFSKDSIMSDVAAAESGFNHWKPSVKRDSVKPGCEDVLKGPVNSDGTYALGVMQIKNIHMARANKLGIDICTLEGNLRFARVLYEIEGTHPWKESAPVWRDHFIDMAEAKKAGMVTNSSLSKSSDSGESETIFITATKTVTDSVDRKDFTQIDWWVPIGKENDAFVVIDDGSSHPATSQVPPSQYYRFVSRGDTLRIKVVLKNN